MALAAETPNSSTMARRPAHRARWLLAVGACLSAVGLLATTVVMVDEAELVLVERFGRIVAVYDQPKQRGLHLKFPWPIDIARPFDRRVQLFEPPGREVFTRDKKNITVDVYLCWKIADSDPSEESDRDPPVVRFYRGVGASDVAEARLDSRIRSVLATLLGQVDLSDLLRVVESDGPENDEDRPLAILSGLLKAGVASSSEGENDLAQRLGIEIVDVRVRRLGFPTGNQSAVFERMRSERRKIAESYRSAGMAENRMITSRADRQYNAILARARADAERIRGEGDAESIRILNSAHARDPELYRTLRTLDAYKRILNEKTTLVLSASNQLLKLLSQGIPEEPGPPPASSTEATPAEATLPK